MTSNPLVVAILLAVAKIALLTIMVLPLGAGYIVLAERKLLGYIQARVGPNRVGPWGLLQPIADAVKLMIKEDITPTHARKVVHFLAPCIMMIPAFVVFAVIPWSYPPSVVQNIGQKGLVSLAGANLGPITDVDIGLLFVVAVSSIGVFGLILGGWASNNKYSLMGGLRSAAQMVSYEVPLALALATVLIFTGSFRMSDIVLAQYRSGMWFVFPAFAAFVLYFISGVAETNRSPFDLPEAESELVGGFHTEYSGMSFAFFFLAEYANILVVSSLAVTLFFGGWLPIFPSIHAMWLIPPIVWFLVKLFLFVFLYIWIRATFPRYRFDQLMELGWKRLIPIALVNVFVVSGIVLVPGQIGPWPSGYAILAAVNLILLAIALWRIFRPLRPTAAETA